MPAATRLEPRPVVRTRHDHEQMSPADPALISIGPILMDDKLSSSHCHFGLRAPILFLLQRTGSARFVADAACTTFHMNVEEELLADAEAAREDSDLETDNKTTSALSGIGGAASACTLVINEVCRVQVLQIRFSMWPLVSYGFCAFERCSGNPPQGAICLGSLLFCVAPMVYHHKDQPHQ